MKPTIMILDGGLGTCLKSQYNNDLWSADVLINDPKRVRELHLQYSNSGADILTTCSYQLTPRIYKYGYRRKNLINLYQLAIELASGFNKSIALSIGPYAAYLANGSEYTGQYKVGYQESLNYHQEIISIIKETDCKVDFIAYETIPNFTELKVICSLLNTLPIHNHWISITCTVINGVPQLRDGTPLFQIKDWLISSNSNNNIKYFGVNCVDPLQIVECLDVFQGFNHLVAYPNSGELYENGQWIGNKHILDEALIKQLIKRVVIVGGCCRVHPADIYILRDIVETYS